MWIASGLILVGALLLSWQYKYAIKYRRPIRVGILHSLTGTMAFSEKPVVEAALMAIDEINERGGLLGRTIEPLVVDGRSDWDVFAREAERLIAEEDVSVVFGCWTSASRKAVKPVFEEHDHLLFYPVQYEGLEQSPNIIYTGAAPNQQIVPAVKWSLDNLGRRLFLVGSDYVFPRAANAIIRDYLDIWGGEVVGEEYRSLGSADFADVVQRILATKPDVVINTINGDSNLAFFKALHQTKISSSKIPIMSLSLAEEELQHIKRLILKEYPEEVEHMIDEHLAGNYSAWNYFQSIDSERNRAFVSAFKERYGEDRVVDDPMEAAYFGVHLWAQAVAESRTDKVAEVRKALKRQSYDAPEGVVSIDPHNNHTWKMARIGRTNDDLQFDIIWSSKRPIRPIPYSKTRSKMEWNEFLRSLEGMR